MNNRAVVHECMSNKEGRKALFECVNELLSRKVKIKNTVKLFGEHPKLSAKYQDLCEIEEKLNLNKIWLVRESQSPGLLVVEFASVDTESMAFRVGSRRLCLTTTGWELWPLKKEINECIPVDKNLNLGQAQSLLDFLTKFRLYFPMMITPGGMAPSNCQSLIQIKYN